MMTATKRTTGLLAVLAAFVLAFAMAVPAWAADDVSENLDNNTGTYTIKIDNGVAGQSYSAYKVFDVTLANAAGNPSADSGFSYTIKSTDGFFDTITKNVTPVTATGVYNCTDYGLTLTPSASDATTYVVTSTMSDLQAANLAAALAADTTKPTASGTITFWSASGNTMTVSSLGYYFVNSTTGSLCSLDTTNQDVTIYEKNSLPTITKQVQEDSNNSWASEASAAIGQTVQFKMTVNTGTNTHPNDPNDPGVNKNYVITDQLPAGMTFVEIASIVDNAGASGASKVTWAEGTNYSYTDNGDGSFTIELFAAAVESLGQNKDIVITYSATLDTDAVIASTGNVNTATLAYGTYTAESSSATVYTYAMSVVKYNADKRLDGAVFTFPFTATQVSAGSDDDPAVYKLTSENGTTDITTTKSGNIIIIGLDEATYNVTEKTAPEGYNPLAAAVPVTVAATHVATVDKDFSDTNADFVAADDAAGYQINQASIQGILNQTGAELPSTGGIGTTIFYVVGGILVVAAVIFLVMRRRSSRRDDA